jgi:peptide/nickel transport system ATP-binding protein
VRDVSFDVGAGEVVGLVGESGSGKTLIARAIPGLLPPHGEITGGAIEYESRDLLSLSREELRLVRGAGIGMVFQEPMVSLNPSLTVGVQLSEGLDVHCPLPRRAIRQRSLEMLSRVRIPDPERSLRMYPHEFSGGMRQRLMLASVFLLRPRLLIADEPTTALDALSQKGVLDLLLGLARDSGTAVLLVTHDLGLLSGYAERVLVLQRGELVEEGPVQRVLRSPAHEYTRRLVQALPRRDSSPKSPGLSSARRPLVEVQDLRVGFRHRRRWPWQRRTSTWAVHGATLRIGEGETVAVVGESGSGKTTLGRAVLRLVEGAGGRILFEGEDVARLAGEPLRRLRQRAQIVFQDPYSSLDPRMRVGAIVAEGLRLRSDVRAAERRERAARALAEVGLAGPYADRWPHQLSGGQRQRVCIARALIMEPRLIVADEPVSALDVTIRAEILDLLRRLRDRFQLAYLFISHDLAVVEQIADRVVVMRRGRVVEMGPREAIFEDPRHPYTHRLLEASTCLVPDGAGGVEARPRALTPAGLRCGDAGAEPDLDAGGGRVELREVAPGHFVALSPEPGSASSQGAA